MSLYIKLVSGKGQEPVQSKMSVKISNPTEEFFLSLSSRQQSHDRLPLRQYCNRRHYILVPSRTTC